MNPDLARQVWERANGRCEYCRMPASVYPLPFHVDHIIARQHGGATVFARVPEALPMRNSKGAVVYYLFFASQKDTAENIVLDIFKKYRSRGAV